MKTRLKNLVLYISGCCSRHSRERQADAQPGAEESSGLAIPVRNGTRSNKLFVNKRSKAIQKKVSFSDQAQKSARSVRSNQISGHETKIKRHSEKKKEHDLSKIYKEVVQLKKQIDNYNHGNPEENQLMMSSQEQSGKEDSESEEEVSERSRSEGDDVSATESMNKVLDDEEVLRQAHPHCTLERIRKEREFQSAHYIMDKYLKSINNQKISQKQHKKAILNPRNENEEEAFKEFVCPLCHKLIQKCVTTFCGHSYCESCLDDYLIYKETCFVCDFDGAKNQQIRDKSLIKSFKVDEIINQLMEGCKTKSIKLEWKQRQEKWKKIQEAKQVKDLEIDSKVDVRDKDYIWCQGVVKLIIEQINKDPMYVVHYQGMSNQWDEFICQSSGRLAKHGTYTSRKDIPRYLLSQDKSISCIENQILTSPQSNACKEKSPIESGIDPDDKEIKDNDSLDGDEQVEIGSNEAIEQQINTFMDQFEETNLDQQRIQRFTDQSAQSSRPMYLRNYNQAFNPVGQPRTSGIGNLVDNLNRLRQNSPQQEARPPAREAVLQQTQAQIDNLLNEFFRADANARGGPRNPNTQAQRQERAAQAVASLRRNRNDRQQPNTSLSIQSPNQEISFNFDSYPLRSALSQLLDFRGS